MGSAFFYLTACSLRNLARVQLRRLREPRYFIALAAGLLYFGMMFRPSGVSSRLFATWRANGLMEIAAGALLFVTTASAWILPRRGGPALAFTRAEVQFLFPAPVRRRQLIHYKLLRAQSSVLVSSAITTIFLAPSSPAGVPVVFGGLWFIMTALSLHLMGVSLSRRSVGEHGIAGVSRQWLPLALVTAATIVAGGTIAADWPSLSAAPTAAAFFQELQRITATGVAGAVLWPFRAIVRAALATSGGEFLRAVPAALALVALNAVWVVRSDAAFEEASAELAEKTALARKGQSGATPRRGRLIAPFALAPTGRIEIAILWKNLILVGRRSPMAALVAVISGALVVMALQGGGGSRMADIAGNVCLTCALVLALLGPMTMRSDLRYDLAQLAVLKTWPVRGAALVRGEILAPAIVLSLGSSVLLACGTALSRTGPFEGLAAHGRPSFAAAAIAVSAAMIVANLVLQNAVAVMFPGWVRIGPAAAAGVEMMGQSMLVMWGSAIVLAVAIIPAAIAAGVAALLLNLAAGSVPIVLPATLFAAVLLLECLAATQALGRVLDGTDLNAIGRAE